MDIVSKLWATLRALIGRIGKAHKAKTENNDDKQQARLHLTKYNAVRMLEVASGDLRLAWDSVADPSDRTAAALAIIQACADDADEQ